MRTELIAGRYELVRRIGRGAMGEIWEALDRILYRKVAIKLMSAEAVSSSTARLRFDREARAVAQMRNPHVVQIYDYGIDDDDESPFIVMELLEGEDLESRLARVQRLPLRALQPLVTQVALALGAAHGKGIIHRDLKPANVFMARGETEEHVKVLDFGVVSLLGAGEPQLPDVNVTASGGIVGTPMYMSPEQIRGGAVDHRSDLWSLGILIYRALVGQNPFTGPWLGMLMVRICTDSFLPPSSLLPELSPEVDQFFERALAKNPERRFATAKDMAAAFTSLGERRERVAAKVLVVDDEPDVQVLIKQRFRQHIRRGAYEFVFAVNGEQALEQLGAHPDIGVVLTDINMPVMDGLTLLSHIGEKSPLVRTIIASAYGDMDNIRTAMNRGAYDFVVKPIDFKDLEVTIDKTLRHVQELRTNARSSEENSVLRMFVSPGLLERLRSTQRFGAIDTSRGTAVLVVVVGFHERSRGMSPGEWVQTLNANFEVIVPAIANRGGVVDKFLGDAALAVFRGDGHVERALDACLDLRLQLRTLALRAGESSPFGLGVAVGVATGELLSGEIGSKAFGRLDFTVLGEVTRAAAALQVLAGRNKILVDRETFEHARHAFEYAAVQAPGPVEAFELVRRAEGGSAREAEAEPHGDTTSVFVKDDDERTRRRE